MVAPVIIGAAIAGGASLLGGKKSSDEASQINAAQLAFAREQMAFQKEMAQHGVRWRVEDAKAAGLHPLHAMGGILPSASPVSVDFQTSGAGAALSEAGQSIGRAVAAQMTPAERAAQELQLKLGEAQLAESDARRVYYLSEAARTLGPSQVGPGSPIVNEDVAPGVIPGQVQVQAPVVAARARDEQALAAGQQALLQEYVWPDGKRSLLPATVSGEISEALESMGLENPSLMLAVFSANVERYGMRYALDALQRHVPGAKMLSERLLKVWSPLGERIRAAREGRGERRPAREVSLRFQAR